MTSDSLPSSRSIDDDQLESMVKNVAENELVICSLCACLCTSHQKHQLVSTQCGHLFGKNCIRKRLKDTHQCPTCHKDLSTRAEQQLRPMCLSSVVTIFPSELSRMREERQRLRNECQRIQTRIERTQRKFDQNRRLLKRMNQTILQDRQRYLRRKRCVHFNVFKALEK